MSYIDTADIVTACQLCPRKCSIDRTQKQGFCGISGGIHTVKVARAALHFWEEPCISGEKGSGTVFFSGCCLRCCYCQNHSISAEGFGAEISTQRLGAIFMELQEQGAHNINLVTGSHFAPQIVEALQMLRPNLHIPIVFNCSGYESEKVLDILNGYVDIYLPDFKYYSSERSGRYSCAPDYFQVASKAILDMYRQVGKTIFNKDGIMTKGLMIRHMVLPKGVSDTIEVLRWIKKNLPLDDILISVMSQYTPFYHSSDFPEINRRLTQKEYDRVLDILDELGIENGFVQERSSAKEEYTPNFSLQGVLE